MGVLLLARSASNVVTGASRHQAALPSKRSTERLSQDSRTTGAARTALRSRNDADHSTARTEKGATPCI